MIVADPDYHAAGIYESAGFRPVERVCGVCRPSGPSVQPGANASPSGASA